MTTWIDPIQPNHGIVPYEVVAAAAGSCPNGPTRGTIQGDRLPIEVNVPPAWVERQHRQLSATTGTAKVDGTMLGTNPKLTVLDCIEFGQHLYKDGPKYYRTPLLRISSV